jgi:hypothetical protein
MGMKVKRIAGTVGPIVAGALALAVGLAKPQKVRAEGDATEKNERCATRLSVAFLGKSPTAQMLGAANPQEGVDALLTDPAFVERFSRFINSEFNPEPGDNEPEDASYFLTKYVLENNKPWKDMFVGQYDVQVTGTGNAATAAIVASPTGLGYFRSRPWMVRYAGNELAGYRIVSAYRILQNTTGLELTATTNTEGVDLSSKGREAPACAQCHYSNWYALDKVARVLSIRKGTGNNMTFDPPKDGPQQILGGQTITDDKGLVEALVASENFKFNTCRLSFKFLYGRAESTCEGKVFDACMDAFNQKGTMQAAIAAVAKDPTFCQ